MVWINIIFIDLSFKISFLSHSFLLYIHLFETAYLVRIVPVFRISVYSIQHHNVVQTHGHGLGVVISYFDIVLVNIPLVKLFEYLEIIYELLHYEWMIMKDTSKLCKVKLIMKYCFKILDSDKIVIKPHSEPKILHKHLLNHSTFP